MAQRMRVSVAVALCALATAGLAAGESDALKCHPDLRGTRSLTVDGDVTSYAFARGRVSVRWRRGACAGTAVWNYVARPKATASGTCASATRSSAAASMKLTAAQGDRLVRVVLSHSPADTPDRLDVFDRASLQRLASWPLFERPARVALFGDIAIVSAAKRQAVDAVRITDGRIAMLGIARAGDRPLIGRQGVLYQDDLDLTMHRVAPHRTTLKLVPLATVRREFRARGARGVSTSRINAISMDGKRVAFVVHDPQGRCDKVLFWSIPWHFVSRLTQRVGPTCTPTHARGDITDVAIAGDRAVWTTRYGGTTRVLGASIIDCVEWLLARPDPHVTRVAGLAGHGGVLAFALRRSRTSAVGVVRGHWRTVPLARSISGVVAMAAEDRRVAVLHGDGTAAVLARDGHVAERFFAGDDARAIALQGKTLAVLRSGAVDIYRLGSGQPARAVRVPSNARSVDVQYGIVVVASGRNVVAANIETGRTVRLFRAPGRVAVEIEAPGAVVQYNIGGRGYLRFVPMSVVEARTALDG